MENLFEYYKSRCEKHDSKILFDRKISYAQAFSLALGRAAFLQIKGYRKGDVIAIVGNNSCEWCITYMALTSAGFIVYPVDYNLDSRSISEISDFLNVKAFFSDEEFLPKLKGKVCYPLELSSAMGSEKDFKQAELSIDDYASFVCTSGTTGKPKVVMLTHKNVTETCITNSDYVLYPTDNFLCILPLFHVYAFVANFIGPFAKGASFYFLRSLKAPDIIKTLAEDTFTVFSGAPQLWELFLDGILAKARNQSSFKYKIMLFFLNTSPVLRAVGLGFLVNKVFQPVRNVFGSSMRFFISGGAPLKKKYYKYYQAMGLKIMEGYGLTETTGPIMLSNDDANLYKVNKPGSIGKIMKGNELKLKNINEEGIGEVWLRGNSVFAGYYKNDEANKEAFDGDGFFNTGDIGRLDKDGDLFLTGRKKNTIILDSGKNVYPDEIEAHIKKSALVADVAVFGEAVDSRETVCAVIVPVSKQKDAYIVIKNEIAILNAQLPSYKRIGKFALSIDALPKNSTRKTLMNEVRRLFREGNYQTDSDSQPVSRIVLTAKNSREDQIILALKKRFKRDTFYANELLFDFGIDSLGLIDLIVYLEDELMISIDEQRMRSAETIEQLVMYLSDCPERTGAGLDDMILSSPITSRMRYFPNPINYSFVIFVKVISKIFWRLKTVNRDNLGIPNVIIAANHSSYLDILWIFASVRFSRRKHLCLTGKKELGFIKYLCPGAPVVFIQRGGNVVPSLKASADILRIGKSLIIFPEGTRSENGSLGEFKTGTAYLSKKLGKKIVPVKIKGASEAMPRGKFFPRFFSGARGTLIAGNPIDPDNYRTIDELNTALRKTIAGL